MILRKFNFSKKQIISVVFILLAIPLTLVFLRQTQVIKQNALESTITCHTDDITNFPNGYEYSPGALDVWVVKSDGPGSTNEIGTISGVSIHAQAKHDNEPPEGSPNRARTEVDGGGCGFSADGTTDGNGYTHLEPLNCGHNNFAISSSGLPSNVIWIGSTYNNGALNANDISNLDLRNGTTDVIKLYYYETQGPPSPPTDIPNVPTPTDTPPTPTSTTGPSPTPPATCVYTPKTCVNNQECVNSNIESLWCYAGRCISCATPPPPTSTPTPTICPIPGAVTNIRIDCPYCP